MLGMGLGDPQCAILGEGVSSFLVRPQFPAKSLIMRSPGLNAIVQPIMWESIDLYRKCDNRILENTWHPENRLSRAALKKGIN